METNFQKKVLSVVKGIPRGSVLAYGEVASAAGYPGAARAVGTLMKHNYDPQVPCHRVIAASGFIGSYNRGGTIEKARILLREGVQVDEKNRVRRN